MLGKMRLEYPTSSDEVWIRGPPASLFILIELYSIENSSEMNGSSTAKVVGKKRCPATPWPNEVEGVTVIISKAEAKIDRSHILVELFVLRFMVNPFFIILTLSKAGRWVLVCRE
jgi:hypothetical protein